MSSQHALKYYARPNDLEVDVKTKINGVLREFGYVDFKDEDLIIHEVSEPDNIIHIPLEIIGRIMGLIQNGGATVRKHKNK